MFLLIWRSLYQRGIRTLLLIFGVLMVSGAFGLMLSLAETVRVVVDEELARYWRTTYDILVRPSGTRSAIEGHYGLVQGNHLSSISGGITFQQYEAIRSIPGVEVAAPIAIISWFGLTVLTSGGEVQLPRLTEPGFYRVVTVLSVHDGWQEQEVRLVEYLYFPSGPVSLSWEEQADLAAHRLQVASPETPLIFKYTLPFLLAAVDPEQEAALVGLDRAIVSGSYFSGDALPRVHTASLERGGNLHAYFIPVLVNIYPYVQAGVRQEIWRLPLSPEEKSFREVLARGGALYLDILPSEEKVGEGRAKYSVEEIHREVAQGRILPLYLWSGLSSLPIAPAQGRVLPGPARYEEIQVPWASRGPVLEWRPESSLNEAGIRFRPLVHWPIPGVREEDWIQIVGEIVGSFDIEKMSSAGDGLADVPLETYYPPLVTLRYLEDGSPVEPPRVIRPILHPGSYIQHPPLLLTTLETAKLFNPVDPISAIRVRIGEIDRYTPQAQAMIESIAAEIIARTGLQVDVVVGSSPRRLLVHIPGMGYVEEPWVQKGVNLRVGREVKKVNLLLFGMMLIVCGGYTLNTTLMSMFGRRGEIGLLKALGWQSSTVFSMLMAEAAWVGLVSGALGLGLAGGIAGLLGLQLPPARAVLILPIGLGLCLVGSLIPAVVAAHTPPVTALQRGEVTGRAFAFAPLSLETYALRGLSRRRIRLVLALIAMVIAAGLITLFGSATISTRGYISGTLLGEYLLLRIEGYHYGMAVVVCIVAALSVADVLVVEVLERRREIGVLKAVGWRTGAVMGLFLAEGALLGLAGGLAGTALGLGVYLALYRELGAGLLGAAVAGLMVPVLVGLVAAVYPARVAARVPPAEAVRAE